MTQQSQHPSLDDIFPDVKKNFDTVPFNLLMGLQLTAMNAEQVTLRLDMKDELVGNQHHQMLHGGVISSVLDAVGGASCMAATLTRMNNAKAPAEEYQRLANIGTINLHVDFLRPGTGSYFIATGKLLRAGKKVVAIRMELHNDEGLLIAVAGGIRSDKQQRW